MQNPYKEIEEHYNKAVELALDLIEKRARAIMRKNGNVHEFCMAMGTASFTLKAKDRNGYHIGLLPEEEYAYMKPVRDVINEWDSCLGLTGYPMRFTADGPVVTDW